MITAASKEYYQTDLPIASCQRAQKAVPRAEIHHFEGWAHAVCSLTQDDPMISSLRSVYKEPNALPRRGHPGGDRVDVIADNKNVPGMFAANGVACNSKYTATPQAVRRDPR
jgi:hypothetical protein